MLERGNSVMYDGMKWVVLAPFMNGDPSKILIGMEGWYWAVRYIVDSGELTLIPTKPKNPEEQNPL